MLRQLVLSVFRDRGAADDAAKSLQASIALQDLDTLVESDRIQAMGILWLDADGTLKSERLGPRTVGVGASIGMLIGRGLLGALHRTSPFIDDDERERLGRELQGGKAALGVLTRKMDAAGIAAELTELGGSPEVHDLDDATMSAIDAAGGGTEATNA